MTKPLLPHAPPMHWLDAASLSEDGLVATATAVIGADHPFVREGYLLSTALIELMAQGAAAGSILQGQRSGRKIQRGALAAFREAVFYAPVPVGATVTLIATHERSFGALTQAHLEARIDDTLIASAIMTFHLTFE